MRAREKTFKEVSSTDPPAEKEWAVDPVGVATMNPLLLALMILLPLWDTSRLSIFSGAVGRSNASFKQSPTR